MDSNQPNPPPRGRLHKTRLQKTRYRTKEIVVKKDSRVIIEPVPRILRLERGQSKEVHKEPVVDITVEQAKEFARSHLAKELARKPSDLKAIRVETVAHMHVVDILVQGNGGASYKVRVNRYDGSIEP